MNLITRDLDGDELRVSSIRINEDGVRLSEPALQIDSTGRLSFNATTINEERNNIFRREYFGVFDSTSELETRRISDRVFNNSRYIDPSPDLVFLDMKVENLGDTFKTTITYIDKKNYQEIKKEYFSNVSFSHEYNLSNNNRLNIEIQQYGEIIETRKDI